MGKATFARAMAYAAPMRDFVSLRIRLQMRFGSLSKAFEHVGKRYLEEADLADLLSSVGGTLAEARRFFAMMLVHSIGSRETSQVGRRTFLLTLRYAEGLAAARRLGKALELAPIGCNEQQEEAAAFRCAVGLARRRHPS
ncbi:unnamed protein product [Effrenium voratum]|nr:unnamed protein product [Effrenium voratum]